jgi:hypothetical protein
MMREHMNRRARRMLAISRGGLALAIGFCLASPAAGDGGARSRMQRNPDAQSIRSAVNRALPLLVKASSVEYPLHRDCFSCHNQGVPALALTLARQRGLPVDARSLRAIAEHTEADLEGAIDDYRKGQGQPGGIIRAGYALWTLEATGWEPDDTTAAVAHYLDIASRKKDHWPTSSTRPPSEASDFTATALALRGLRAFGRSAPTLAPDGAARQKPGDPRPRAAEIALRPQALDWLIRATPRDTEDRVFRLWGLKEASASADDLAAAVADLLRSQRPDGGWRQLDESAESPKRGPDKPSAAAHAAPESALESDAYATGSVLVALSRAGGVDTGNLAYRRGVEFLLRTQREDGSWFVKSRSRPFQTYFESGFPHGPNQFISAAASAWAVAALTLALPAD